MLSTFRGQLNQPSFSIRCDRALEPWSAMSSDASKGFEVFRTLIVSILDGGQSLGWRILGSYMNKSAE